jgi:hypothetical protein
MLVGWGVVVKRLLADGGDFAGWMVLCSKRVMFCS